MEPCAVGATGLAIADDMLWFTSGENVYRCSMTDGAWNPELFIRLRDNASGVAVSGNSVYVSCQRRGEISVFRQNRS